MRRLAKTVDKVQNLGSVPALMTVSEHLLEEIRPRTRVLLERRPTFEVKFRPFSTETALRLMESVPFTVPESRTDSESLKFARILAAELIGGHVDDPDQAGVQVDHEPHLAPMEEDYAMGDIKEVPPVEFGEFGEVLKMHLHEAPHEDLLDMDDDDFDDGPAAENDHEPHLAPPEPAGTPEAANELEELALDVEPTATGTEGAEPTAEPAAEAAPQRRRLGGRASRKSQA